MFLISGSLLEGSYCIKNTNFYPEVPDMTIFGKSACQKVVNLHLYCHNFSETCPKAMKIGFSNSSWYELFENISFT